MTQSTPPTWQADSTSLPPMPAPVAPQPDPRRTRAGMSRGVVVGALVAAVLLAAAGFAGGYVYGKNATPSAAPVGAGFGNGGFFGGAAGASGAPGRAGAFGGGATGTIVSVGDGQFSVSLPNQGSRIVLFTAQTPIEKVATSTGASSDLQAGQQVTVRGTTNPDGSVTASRIVVGDLGDVLGAGGRNFGPGASGAPDGARGAGAPSASPAP
jgi:hypothetical protein